MSASTATASTSTIPSSDSPRPGRLRRLSQLRAYTQNHLSSSSSSNSHRSYRNSFSSRVPWLSPTSHPTSGPESPTQISHVGGSDPAPCPETDPHTLARHTSAPSGGPEPYQGLGVDLNSQASSSESSTSTPSNESESHTSRIMTRLRSSSAVQGRPSLQTPDVASNREASSPSGSESRPTESSANDQNTSADSSDTTPSVDRTDTTKPKQKATIRFYPYQDSHQSSRPSLPFVPITRTLPSDSCVIQVGRYSERDGIPVANPSEPSDAPVGFKSKVVSRKHCEFLYINGQWHVKDVGSSSGTFLNHMRLSQPNMVSRLYAIKDGDIVQLGIDFRGGEEMIFRCVRIRIECNRSWQQQPNEFNKNTESLIKNLGKGDTADYAGCRECSICLGSVLRPYQCLFMAACAHVWHYKCISRLIHTPEYPMFQCPNCRAYTDLSAEVDDSNDLDDDSKEAPGVAQSESQQAARETTNHASHGVGANDANGNQAASDDAELVANIDHMRLDGSAPQTDTEDVQSSRSPALEPNVDAHPSPNVDVRGWQSLGPSPSLPQTRQAQLRSDTPVRSESSEDNPMTPRNDSGPLAFDGRAGMP